MEHVIVTDRIRHMAEAMAYKSDYKDRHIQVGAVIVKGRRIIAGGFNQNKTHTIIRNQIDKYSLVDKLHAEMSAILKSRTDLGGAKIYVLRVCPDNEDGTGMSRPCGLCMRLIRGAGIKEIIYTTGDPSQPWMKERIINGNERG
jgi:deoxycytidylate deaminase